MTENISDTSDPAPDPKRTADAGADADQAASPTNAPKDKMVGGGSESATPEQELWSGRTSWKHFAGRIAFATSLSLLAVIAAALWGPAGSVLIVFLLATVCEIVVGAQIAITVFGVSYRITSERLFINRGIIRQTIDQTELIRVDDVRVEKLLIDRILGLGSIDIRSTDASDTTIRIDGVEDAEGVAEVIRARMRTARRNSLFMETL